MKIKIILGIAICLTTIIFWDRAAKIFAPAAPPPPAGHRLISQHAKEILPGSRSRWDLIARSRTSKDSPVETANNTPQMTSEACGPYSYQGAANEFKAICGFEIPNWVEPVDGHYYITKHGKQFVSQARLEYKIDPSRRDELAGLMIEGSATLRPGLPAITFGTQPIEGKPDAKTSGYSLKQPDGRADEFSMVLFADGRVALSNTRGPEGWDR